MSLISALARAYERLPDRPPFGCSVEKIGLLVSLSAKGEVASVIDLRLPDAKAKPRPRLVLVPQPVKRTVAIAPNFLWDKTSYALGVTAGAGKRTAKEHAAFVRRHEKALAGEEDEGLRAFLAFLRSWSPDRFQPPSWADDYRDLNVVFGLESERLAGVFLHDRPASQAALLRQAADGDRDCRVCAVTGKISPIARLHPSIKGVRGAQSSGAALVSFNLEAFTSYGHEQGNNAQIGEWAVFAYATALNRFLARDSGHCLQIGDMSTVFWADACEPAVAALAEAYFTQMIEPQRVRPEQRQNGAGENSSMAVRIQERLQRMEHGETLAAVEPVLGQGVRFQVAGLAPNAARLSLRFYFEDSFQVLADNYCAYCRDISIEPQPDFTRRPSLLRFLARTASARRDPLGAVRYDPDSVSPLLAGELLRAILTGARFPSLLLSTLLMRVRRDGVIDAVRISLIKAVIQRDRRLAGMVKEDYLMRPDLDDTNPARHLGRLFAVIERAQSAALGDKINATIAEKFLAAASAAPRQVLPSLILKARTYHIKQLRNGHSNADWIQATGKKSRAECARDYALLLDKKISSLLAHFDEGFPQQFSTEEQGLFLIGYYQERWGRSAGTSSEEHLAQALTEEGSP